jgi:hypothetical protein
VAGHATGYVSPAVLRGSGVAVRAGRYPYFNHGWYAAHPAAWVAPRWVAGYNLWRPVGWATLAAFSGITAPAVAYDYGSTVVIQDNAVRVNGDSVGTPEEYAAQATAFAVAGRDAKPADADEWQPLGVFGMVRPDDTVAKRIFQLAVNKGGVVRGNYYDAVTDTTLPVFGSVDKKSQRVAWTIGEKKGIVFETGLPNLAKDDSTMLIHSGEDRTEQQMLVRIEEPKDGKK